jgi:hypothetical protein
VLVGSSARACLEETNEPGRSGEQGWRRCILKRQTGGSGSGRPTRDGQVIYVAIAVGAWRGGGEPAVFGAAVGKSREEVVVSVSAAGLALSRRAVSEEEAVRKKHRAMWMCRARCWTLDECTRSIVVDCDATGGMWAAVALKAALVKPPPRPGQQATRRQGFKFAEAWGRTCT